MMIPISLHLSTLCSQTVNHKRTVYFTTVRNISFLTKFDNCLARLLATSGNVHYLSNKLVLLNIDCSFFYFDELVIYYAVSCLAGL